MFKTFSYIAITFLGLVALITTTPFISFILNGTPERLVPSMLAGGFLFISFFILRKAKQFSNWPALFLAMALIFLALILVSTSWVRVPFGADFFLIAGNVSIILFIVSLIFSLISLLLSLKTTR